MSNQEQKSEKNMLWQCVLYAGIGLIIGYLGYTVFKSPEVPAEIDARQSFQDGVKALQAKDYNAAVKYLQLAADAGVVQANTYLGMCYIEGWGIEKNPATAVAYFNIAAGANDPMALTCLGSCYLKGLGVEKDLTKAAGYYKSAADLGDAVAQFMYGSCCIQGTGIEKNPGEGKKYLQMAAEKGHKGAQKMLESL